MDTLTQNQTVDPSPGTSEEIAPRPRISLRDAVRLCGMSEKTLRRKLEAGLLQGNRESLDYGGFMWMIETRSLAELYPDSASLRDFISNLESNLTSAPPPSPAHEVACEPTSAGPIHDLQQEEDSPADPRDFLSFLMDENRTLKEDLKRKDEQLHELHQRAMNLERECGEQKGTAATQARVLEWFQRQPQAALPAPASAEPVPTPLPTPAMMPPARLALLSALAAALIILLTLAVTRGF